MLVNGINRRSGFYEQAFRFRPVRQLRRLAVQSYFIPSSSRILELSSPADRS